MGDLTEHFSWAELTATSHTDLLAANRREAEAYRANLTVTAELLEQVRAILAEPVAVSSAFRGTSLNTKVGGQKTSQHLVGLAADIKVKNIEAAFQKLLAAGTAGKIRWGQLLQEGTWLHISSEKDRNPQRCMEFGRKVRGVVLIEGRVMIA